VCLAAVLAAGCTGGAFTGPRIVFQDLQTWTADLPLPAAVGQAGREEISSSPWMQSLTNQGVQAEVDSSLQGLLQGEGLRLSGDGGTAQLAGLIYGPLADLVEPFSPGTTLTLSGTVKAGELLSITLEANPSTGYAWQAAEDQPALLNLVEAPIPTSFTGITASPAVDPQEPLYGVPQPQVLAFKALESGSASLTLVYRRPWEPVSPGTKVTITAPNLSQLSDLRRPGDLDPSSVPVRVGSMVSATETGPSPSMAVETTLPAAFDWRSQRTLPAVRDQGSCGSCWAFATVGAFESAIAIQGGPAGIDLSEQYLVSCNTQGWSCNGGSTAHDYHKDRIPPSELLAGGVLESQFPYTAKNGTCSGPYNHPYRLNRWGYTNNLINPTPEEIKQAIYTYGPVKVSVCAGTAFSRYTGGIFTTDEKSACGGNTNHAVVLVGWDDAAGVWLLRNSWGPGWGEAGYMRIGWGVSNVGRYTSYVVYNEQALFQHQVYTHRMYIPSVAR